MINLTVLEFSQEGWFSNTVDLKYYDNYIKWNFDDRPIMYIHNSILIIHRSIYYCLLLSQFKSNTNCKDSKKNA